MKSRTASLQTIRERRFEICVIGGGATGTGCALDAQLRGMPSLLLDAGDFVARTSSASTKLVHGGVRYLQQAVAELDYGQYAMVRKALHERITMLRNAPHLAHPLELLVPCAGWVEMGYYAVGMKLYDWISGKASLFPSRLLGKRASLSRMPSLRPEKLAGTISYADGQFDDARYGITLAQTFAREGGALLNYAKVVDFQKDGQGRLIAAEVEDQLSGERFRVEASVFMNCTGPFADHIRLMAAPGAPERLRISKGVHILLPLDRLKSGSALLIPKTVDGRVLFAIPWFGSLLVGTTETEANLTDEMEVSLEEVDYILKQVNQVLDTAFTPNDVQAAFAGLRPLVASKDAVNTKKLIRDHEVEVDGTSGLVSVLGGKWTTYRAMAEDGVDHAARLLGRAGAACRTRDFPLAGAAGFTADYAKGLPDRYGIAPATAGHLAQKFGTDAALVLALAQEDPALLEPLCEGSAAIAAEVVYAVREEMAQTIEDVLSRRIGLAFHSWKESAAAAPKVSRILQKEFAWTEGKTTEALETYLSKLKRHQEAIGLQAASPALETAFGLEAE